MLGPIRMAQLTSIVYIVIGLLGYCGLFERFFKKPKPTMIFDLDGTILDTQNGILATYEMLFAKYRTKAEFSEEIQAEVLGPSLQEMFVKHFPDEDPAKLYEEYRQYNSEIFLKVNKPMDHAIEMLKELKENGYVVGVVSTKRRDTVEDNLKDFDMLQYVDAIVGAEDVQKQKPSPEGLNKILKDNRWSRDEAIYVGDSVMDIAAAKNAGLYSVGYFFNPKKKDNLIAAKANEYIDDLKDVLVIVKKDIYFTSDQK